MCSRYTAIEFIFSNSVIAWEMNALKSIWKKERKLTWFMATRWWDNVNCLAQNISLLWANWNFAWAAYKFTNFCSHATFFQSESKWNFEETRIGIKIKTIKIFSLPSLGSYCGTFHCSVKFIASTFLQNKNSNNYKNEPKKKMIILLMAK